MTTMLDAALAYARKGYAVFPCKPRSKHPATKNGFHDATTTPEIIRGWWEHKPQYNVAIRTGPASGIAVLDVDGDTGEHTLRGHGTLPGTVIVRTGKGWHHYFRYPNDGIRNSAGTLGNGLDVRGDGGYVLAPPSVHPDGGVYEWLMSLEDATLANCPDWLTQRCSGPYNRLPVDVSATIEEGERNTELFRVGSLLRRTYESYDDILTALMMHNERRGNPPLEVEEVERIALSVYENYEPEVQESSSSSSSLGTNDDDYDSTPTIRMFADMTRPTGPRPYIVDGVLFRGFAGAIYGDGGTAKSTLVMHLAQCVARGEAWLGFDTACTNVLYLDFELDEEEQARRAYEIAQGMGYDSPPKGFAYISGAGYKSRDVFKLALDACREHGFGMVIIDSAGYALDGDAESSRDVLGFFREVEGQFRRAGITVLLVDHQAKGGTYQDRTMFGSVYKSNSARSVFQVEPSERGDGYMNLTVRHKKVNFGAMLDPFGVTVEFLKDDGTGEVRVSTRDLNAAELAEEKTLNATDRVVMALEVGPMYPEGIADLTDLDVGTVKNALTKLRKNGTVEDTGNTGKYGAKEVRLTSSSSSSPLGDDYDYDFAPDIVVPIFAGNDLPPF